MAIQTQVMQTSIVCVLSPISNMFDVIETNKMVFSIVMDFKYILSYFKC